MWIFWLTAILIMVIGASAPVLCKRIHWVEWVAASVVALVMALIFQVSAIYYMTSDVETWSGQITSATHTPSWLEYYEYAVYRTEHYTTWETTGTGKNRHSHLARHTRRVFSHWSSSTREHHDEYTKQDNLGRSWSIGEGEYVKLRESFGKESHSAGQRHTFDHASRMLSGDPNDYILVNVNGFVQPTVVEKSWENRVKAAPSKFSFRKVPVGVTVFEYPKVDNPFQSNRLLGDARNAVTIQEWDALNSRLGFSKHVNLIMVGFGKEGESYADWQRSAWFGGKKNDVVICYGGDASSPDWVSVFGWTDSKDCLRQLESICSTGISSVTLPKIESEIRDNYKIKDWSKFDYVKVEPPAGCLISFFAVIALVELSLAAYFSLNQLNKGDRLSDLG